MSCVRPSPVTSTGWRLCCPATSCSRTRDELEDLRQHVTIRRAINCQQKMQQQQQQSDIKNKQKALLSQRYAFAEGQNKRQSDIKNKKNLAAKRRRTRRLQNCESFCACPSSFPWLQLRTQPALTKRCSEFVPVFFRRNCVNAGYAVFISAFGLLEKKER